MLSCLFAAWVSLPVLAQEASEKVTPDDEPYALNEKEQKRLERLSDRRRVEALQKLYEDTAQSGKIKFDHSYLIDKPMTLEEVKELNHPYFTALYNDISAYDKEIIEESVTKDGFKSARYQAILNIAMQYGMQAGDHYTTNHYFERFKNELYPGLSQAFPFQALMLADGKIKPALIEEIGYTSRIEDKRTRRDIKKRYEIAEQAEVIHTSPTIMDFFITLRSKRPKLPTAMLLPANESEMEQWRKGVLSGWTEGVKQASMSTRHHVRNLIRTFYGYLRFHELHDKGMITMPTYQNLTVGTTSRGDLVNIGETVFEITELPQINGDEQEWIALPQIDDIFNKLTEEDVNALSETLLYESP